MFLHSYIAVLQKIHLFVTDTIFAVCSISLRLLKPSANYFFGRIYGRNKKGISWFFPICCKLAFSSIFDLFSHVKAPGTKGFHRPFDTCTFSWFAPFDPLCCRRRRSLLRSKDENYCSEPKTRSGPEKEGFFQNRPDNNPKQKCR